MINVTVSQNATMSSQALRTLRALNQLIKGEAPIGCFH